MKFKKGERVRAKWPGSVKYFLGTVVDVGEGKCEVKFDEGTSYNVLVKNIFREVPSSPGKKSANSISDNSPSQKSSVERSSRKSSTERTTRKSSLERTTRKSSVERTTRKSSERSPSRTSGRISIKPSQKSPNRPAVETDRRRSPGRPKASSLGQPSTVVSGNEKSSLTSETSRLRSSTNEAAGDGDSQFIDSIISFKEKEKELLAKRKSLQVRTEFTRTETSYTSQVSGRRSLRGTPTPISSGTSVVSGRGTPATSTPISVQKDPVIVSTPTSLGLIKRPLLVNGSFSDDDEDDLGGEGERVVTSSISKEVTEESFGGRSSVEPPPVSSVFDTNYSRRESSVLRNSIPPEERPRQWSLDPASRSSVSLRVSARRSIVREVDSNSVHGSVSGRLLKGEVRLHPFNPPDYVEWGGAVGCALWMLLLPPALLALHLHCDKVSCDVKWRGLNVPLTWYAYLDPVAIAMVLCFVGVQGALCVLPVGYQVDLIPNTFGSPKYRCNGLLSAAVSLAVICAMKYLGYSLFAVTSRYFQLLVASLLFSAVLSVVLYVRGANAKYERVNVYTRYQGFLYNFWSGREVYPQFWRLHVKSLLSKVSLVGSLVLAVALLLEEVNWAVGQPSPAMLLCSSMLGLYVLDSLWFEEGVLTSFSMQYEGCGFMMVTLNCAYPFLATVPLRYHLLHRPELSYYTLIVLSVVFLVGFWLYRFSNSLKDKFRRNPLDPAIAHLETIATSMSRGRKLLASSYWGFVRHPNYLGDIIMHFAVACTCGWALALPYALSVCFLAVLLHRASRDGARCAHRYGLDWKRYCSTVKYKVIPFVY